MPATLRIDLLLKWYWRDKIGIWWQWIQDTCFWLMTSWSLKLFVQLRSAFEMAAIGPQWMTPWFWWGMKMAGGFNLWAFHIFSHVKADVHRDFQRCSHGGLFNTCLRFKRHFWWWNSRLLAVLAAWFQSCNPSIQAGSWTDNIKQLFCTHGLAWWPQVLLGRWWIMWSQSSKELIRPYHIHHIIIYHMPYIITI